VSALPPYFVTELELAAAAHERMVAAVRAFGRSEHLQDGNVPRPTRTKISRASTSRHERG